LTTDGYAATCCDGGPSRATTADDGGIPTAATGHDGVARTNSYDGDDDTQKFGDGDGDWRPRQLPGDGDEQ
jgi:hypothetical protein